MATYKNGWWHRYTLDNVPGDIHVKWIDVEDRESIEESALNYFEKLGMDVQDAIEEGHGAFPAENPGVVFRGMEGHHGISETALYRWYNTEGARHCMSWWTDKPINLIKGAL